MEEEEGVVTVRRDGPADARGGRGLKGDHPPSPMEDPERAAVADHQMDRGRGFEGLVSAAEGGAELDRIGVGAAEGGGRGEGGEDGEEEELSIGAVDGAAGEEVGEALAEPTTAGRLGLGGVARDLGLAGDPDPALETADTEALEAGRVRGALVVGGDRAVTRRAEEVVDEAGGGIADHRPRLDEGLGPLDPADAPRPERRLGGGAEGGAEALLHPRGGDRRAFGLRVDQGREGEGLHSLIIPRRSRQTISEGGLEPNLGHFRPRAGAPCVRGHGRASGARVAGAGKIAAK